MVTVFWDDEGIVLSDYLEHGSTITGIYYANLIGNVRTASKAETRKVPLWGAVAPWLRTCLHVMSSTDCRLKCWIPTNALPTVFTTLHPEWLLFASETKAIHEWTQIFRRRRHYLHSKWLAGRPRSTILLQRNPSYGETLDQVHFTCWGLCWKVTEYDGHVVKVSVYKFFELHS